MTEYRCCVSTRIEDGVALRAQNMDHVGVSTYGFRAADRVQRAPFSEQMSNNLQRLEAGTSRATERLSAR